MANLNLGDPAAISAVYTSILEDDNNWLILRYQNDTLPVDEIGLDCYGGHGLEEMKTKVSDLDDIFIAFYREELAKDPGYIIINYVPPFVDPERRAKVLLHSRRIGAILKRHQTIFTVDSLSLITTSNIHQAIRNPGTAFQSSTSLTEAQRQSPVRPLPTAPQPEAQRQPLPPPATTISTPLRPLQPLRASRSQPSEFTTTDSDYNMGARSPMVSSGEGVPPAVSLYPKKSFSSPSPAQSQAVPLVPKGFLSSFLKKKKKGSIDSADSLPPPIPPKAPLTPPKDTTFFPSYSAQMGHSYSQPAPNSSNAAQFRRQRSPSFSEFAVVSHPDDQDSDDMVMVDEDLTWHGTSQRATRRLTGKWATQSVGVSDFEARELRRTELRMRREREERKTMEEEARRQRRIKEEREAATKKEAEAERQRKKRVEEEVLIMKERRRLKEEQERQEEERKRQEIEERRRMNRDRRLEEHRQLELWREEQARKAEAAAQQAEDTRRYEESLRRRKIQQVAAKLKGSKEDTDLSGWITVLNPESLAWKRRYYKFIGPRIFLYRSPNEISSVLDQAVLKNNVRALKEWNEGYEDLEAIKHSFVVEFKDTSQVWSMYADSESEKYKILGLFKLAGGL